MSESPLLPYYNGLILSSSGQTLSINDGRIVIDSTSGSKYLVKVFVSQGPEIVGIPKEVDQGQEIPGASGFAYTYKGYALSVAVVGNTYELDASIGLSGNTSGLVFSNISGHELYLGNGVRGDILLGLDKVAKYQIINSGGVYNGEGIDKLIYSQIKGVPIKLSVGGVYV